MSTASHPRTREELLQVAKLKLQQFREARLRAPEGVKGQEDISGKHGAALNRIEDIESKRSGESLANGLFVPLASSPPISLPHKVDFVSAEPRSNQVLPGLPLLPFPVPSAQSLPDILLPMHFQEGTENEVNIADAALRLTESRMELPETYIHSSSGTKVDSSQTETPQIDRTPSGRRVMISANTDHDTNGTSSVRYEMLMSEVGGRVADLKRAFERLSSELAPALRDTRGQDDQQSSASLVQAVRNLAQTTGALEELVNPVSIVLMNHDVSGSLTSQPPTSAPKYLDHQSFISQISCKPGDREISVLDTDKLTSNSSLSQGGEAIDVTPEAVKPSSKDESIVRNTKAEAQLVEQQERLAALQQDKGVLARRISEIAEQRDMLCAELRSALEVVSGQLELAKKEAQHERHTREEYKLRTEHQENLLAMLSAELKPNGTTSVQRLGSAETSFTKEDYARMLVSLQTQNLRLVHALSALSASDRRPETQEVSAPVQHLVGLEATAESASVGRDDSLPAEIRDFAAGQTTIAPSSLDHIMDLRSPMQPEADDSYRVNARLSSAGQVELPQNQRGENEGFAVRILVADASDLIVSSADLALSTAALSRPTRESSTIGGNVNTSAEGLIARLLRLLFPSWFSGSGSRVMQEGSSDESEIINL